MNNRTRSKPTQEQINALLNKYSTKEEILNLLYTGPVNTPIKLQRALQYGIYLYITNFDNFSKIVEAFYLPIHKDETPLTVRQRFREIKPYKHRKLVFS